MNGFMFMFKKLFWIITNMNILLTEWSDMSEFGVILEPYDNGRRKYKMKQ